jgi:hypothetical protein
MKGQDMKGQSRGLLRVLSGLLRSSQVSLGGVVSTTIIFYVIPWAVSLPQGRERPRIMLYNIIN